MTPIQQLIYNARYVSGYLTGGGPFTPNEIKMLQETLESALRAFIRWVEVEPEFFPEISLKKVGRKYRTEAIRVHDGGIHFTIARESGAAAYADGRSIAENPYIHASALWREWDEGWKEAKES